MNEIKVRNVTKINLIDMILFGRKYFFGKMQKRRMILLPNNGDKIKITWVPDNSGVTNAYIGLEGVVETMNKVEGTFALNSGNAILVCSGDFNYIIL